MEAPNENPRPATNMQQAKEFAASLGDPEGVTNMVENEMEAERDEAEVIASLEGAVVTRKNLFTLKPGQSMDDAVMDYLMNCFNQDAQDAGIPNAHCFSVQLLELAKPRAAEEPVRKHAKKTKKSSAKPLVESQCMDAISEYHLEDYLEHDCLIFPAYIKDGRGSHFVCVIVYPQEHRIVLLDSSKGATSTWHDIEAAVKASLNHAIGKAGLNRVDWTFEFRRKAQVPQQDNGKLQWCWCCCRCCTVYC
jgi:hypothetical protein